MIAVDKNDPLLNYPLGGKYAKGKPTLLFAETQSPRNFMHDIFLRVKNNYNFCRHIVFLGD